MATKTAADFGNPNVNGTYTDSGTKDGQTSYVKDDNSNMILEYRTKWGPYCESGAYYIFSIDQIQGAIPIEDPIYKVDSNDPDTDAWVTMQDQTLGATYNVAGTVS